jgi:hypothetical protein
MASEMMSDPQDPHQADDPPAVDAVEVDAGELAATTPAEEVVDGVPVLAEVRTLASAPASALPAAQAAAAALTGFVAGAATLALLHRRHLRRLAGPARPRTVHGLPVLGTRTFLVDVHVLGSRPERG